MAVGWLLLIALGALAQGRRIPRQYYYEAHSGEEHVGKVQLARVPLAHAPQTSMAVCRLVASTGSQVSGEIIFLQTNADDPVSVIGNVSGLDPGHHGFHIHQNPDLSNDCKAAGPHFNPENNPHGAPADSVRHAGDLGNILADERGFSSFQILDRQITLFDNHPRQVLGRAIVVHQKRDDLGKGGNEESLKTGNAGARVACCVIEPVHSY